MQQHLCIWNLNLFAMILFGVNRSVDFCLFENDAAPSDRLFLDIGAVMTFIRYPRIDPIKASIIAWIVILNLAVEVLHLRFHWIVTFNRSWFVVWVVVYLNRRIGYQTLRCVVIWLQQLLPRIGSHRRLLVLCLVWVLGFVGGFGGILMWGFLTTGPTIVLAIHVVILI